MVVHLLPFYTSHVLRSIYSRLRRKNPLSPPEPMFACVKVRGCRPEQVEDDFAARDFAVFGLEQSIAFSVVDLLAPSSATMAPPRLDPRSTRMVSPQTIWILHAEQRSAGCDSAWSGPGYVCLINHQDPSCLSARKRHQAEMPGSFLNEAPCVSRVLGRIDHASLSNRLDVPWAEHILHLQLNAVTVWGIAISLHVPR
jgi:hypothetical protein